MSKNHTNSMKTIAMWFQQLEYLTSQESPLNTIARDEFQKNSCIMFLAIHVGVGLLGKYWYYSWRQSYFEVQVELKLKFSWCVKREATLKLITDTAVPRKWEGFTNKQAGIFGWFMTEGFIYIIYYIIFFFLSVWKFYFFYGFPYKDQVCLK